MTSTGTVNWTSPIIDVNAGITAAGQLVDLLREVSDDRLLIETDSPYLAPVPKRGKRNQPAYVQYVRDKLAEVRNTTPESIADASTKNAKRIFQIN